MLKWLQASTRVIFNVPVTNSWVLWYPLSIWRYCIGVVAMTFSSCRYFCCDGKVCLTWNDSICNSYSQHKYRISPTANSRRNCRDKRDELTTGTMCTECSCNENDSSCHGASSEYRPLLRHKEIRTICNYSKRAHRYYVTSRSLGVAT